jgi:hypothetical protein
MLSRKARLKRAGYTGAACCVKEELTQPFRGKFVA